MGDLRFIGVDIGGTNVDALLADETHQEIAFVSNPIRGQGGLRPIDVVIQTVNQLISSEKFGQSSKLASIGVGVPGLVDVKTGRVDLAVNLDEPSIELGYLLGQNFGVPVSVENDANAYAIAAAAYLVDPAIKNLAFITLGTGVGGGLVLNGEVYRGSKNMAGEIGHTYAGDTDVRCQCGLYGCLETFVAGPALARQAREVIFSAEESTLKQSAQLDAAAVFHHASSGDAAAQGIVKQMSKVLSRALHTLIMSFDLQKIILGGGLSRAGNGLLHPVLDEWVKLSSQSEMAAEMLQPSILEICPPNFKAGAWGATSIAISNFLEIDPHQHDEVIKQRPEIMKNLRPTM
ncbi:MAG: ROK family protein [Chloroflexota bacterium]